jgi:hypothetical protein
MGDMFPGTLDVPVPFPEPLEPTVPGEVPINPGLTTIADCDWTRKCAGGMAPWGRFCLPAARPITGEGDGPLPPLPLDPGRLLLAALLCKLSAPGMLEVEETVPNLNEVGG